MYTTSVRNQADKQMNQAVSCSQKIWFSSQNRIYKIIIAILAVYGKHHIESTRKKVIRVVVVVVRMGKYNL